MNVRVLRSVEIRVAGLLLLREASDPHVVLVYERVLRDDSSSRLSGPLFWPAHEQDALMFLTALRHVARADIPYRTRETSGGFTATRCETAHAEVQSHRVEGARPICSVSLAARLMGYQTTMGRQGIPPIQRERMEKWFAAISVAQGERQAIPPGFRTYLRRSGETPGAVQAHQLDADHPLTILANEVDLDAFAAAYLRITREEVGHRDEDHGEKSKDGP